MLDQDKTIDAILEVGEFSLPISGSLPCTILIGGTNRKEPELKKTGVLEAEFDGEKISLPQGKVYIASFPYPQLESTTITGNTVTYDLIMHLNGSARAATHWLSDGRWSQRGVSIPPYLGESDLVEISPKIPVSGKDLDIVLKRETPTVYVDTVYDVNGTFLNVKFPHWNDAVLSSPLEITTAGARYIVKKKVLLEEECTFLTGKVDRAIAHYSNQNNPEMISWMKDVVQVNVRRYAGRFRH